MSLDEIHYWVEEFRAFAKAKESAQKKAAEKAKMKRGKGNG